MIGFWREGENLKSLELLVLGTRNESFPSSLSKIFRLQAIPADAAEVVPSHSGKCPGYCHMIKRGPNSCMLGHVTGLLSCLYVKYFLLSFFTFSDF